MYENFGSRYISFDSMPLSMLFRDYMNISKLAKHGLYYSPAEGERPPLVKCAFCNFVLEQWDATTDFCLMHTARYPLCIHLLVTLGVVKVCQILQKTNGDNRALHLWKQNLYEHVIKRMLDDETRTEGNRVSTYTSASGAKLSYPVNMTMTEFASRRSTLDNMPEKFRRMESLEDFADAGFYLYMEELGSDGYHSVFLLRCYYCGIEIKYDTNSMWTYQDPWIAHISLKRQCFHNILMRGDDFTLTGVQGCDGQYLGLQNGQEKRKFEQSNPGENNQINDRKTLRMAVRSNAHINTTRPSSHMPHSDVNQRTQNSSSGQQGNSGGRKTCFSCKRYVDQSHGFIHICCAISVCEICTRRESCPKCNRKQGI